MMRLLDRRTARVFVKFRVSNFRGRAVWFIFDRQARARRNPATLGRVINQFQSNFNL